MRLTEESVYAANVEYTWAVWSAVGDPPEPEEDDEEDLVAGVEDGWAGLMEGEGADLAALPRNAGTTEEMVDHEYSEQCSEQEEWRGRAKSKRASDGWVCWAGFAGLVPCDFCTHSKSSSDADTDTQTPLSRLTLQPTANRHSDTD